MVPVLNYINLYLMRWLMRKHKSFVPRTLLAIKILVENGGINARKVCALGKRVYPNRLGNDVYIRFCEGLEVQFLRSTQPYSQNVVRLSR